MIVAKEDHLVNYLGEEPKGIYPRAALGVRSATSLLGIDHSSNVDTAGKAMESRTNLHVGTSLAFADGALAIGRPIYDSFALVTGHKSLGGANVILDPTPYGYTAATGLVGTATEPDMMSYTEKNIVIDVPDAPAGFDLGKGAFRLRPPYPSGYRLQVGSDYSVTVVGRLLDPDNQPLALMQGAATEVGEPGRAPLELFTNRDGRFGVAGTWVRSGR